MYARETIIGMASVPFLETLEIVREQKGKATFLPCFVSQVTSMQDEAMSFVGAVVFLTGGGLRVSKNDTMITVEVE